MVLMCAEGPLLWLSPGKPLVEPLRRFPNLRLQFRQHLRTLFNGRLKSQQQRPRMPFVPLLAHGVQEEFGLLLVL